MERLERIFKSVLPNKNFMTPCVVGYFKKGNYIIELSTDSVPFCGLHSYGVTVVDTDTMSHCVDLSESFSNKNENVAKREAMEYIESFD